MTVVALDTDRAKTIALVVIVGMIVLGAVLSAIISAIVGRIVVLLIALVLAAVVWSQRADIESAAKKCDATLFGVHLTPSNDTLKRKCQDAAN